MDARANGPRGSGGFTVVEMVITLGIIAVLATLAIVNYLGFRERAMKVEARLGLHNIWLLEKTYQKENDRYSANLNEINFRMDGTTRYTYSLQATANSFTGRAVANLDGDADLDVWEIYTPTPDARQLLVD